MERKMAWIESADKLAIRVSELPPLGADEVLIKTEYSAICGSDLHLYHDRHPFVKAPSTIGHELCGRIVAVGEKVTDFSVGQRVVPEPILTCGKCDFCRSGQYHMCRHVSLGYRQGQAGFGDYYICQDQWVHPLPDTLSAKAGALIEPLSVAIHGCEKAGEMLGRSVVIMGAGAIGAFAAAVCRAKGATTVILVDTNQTRLEIAGKGVTSFLINPSQCDAAALIDQITNHSGCHAVIECTGALPCAKLALEVVRPMGTIVQMGIPSSEFAGYPYARLISKEITLKGSQAYCFDFQKAIELAASGAVPLERYISRIFPFEQIQQAFELVCTPGTPVMKVLISYGKDA